MRVIKSSSSLGFVIESLYRYLMAQLSANRRKLEVLAGDMSLQVRVGSNGKMSTQMAVHSLQALSATTTGWWDIGWTNLCQRPNL